MKNRCLKKSVLLILRFKIPIAFFLPLLFLLLAASEQRGLDRYRRNLSLRHFNEGVRLESSKDLQKAMKEYEKAIDMDPYNPYPFLNLGTIYFYQGDLLLAKYYYLIALKNDPSYGKARSNLDLCREKLLEEGLSDLEGKALEAQKKARSLMKEGKYQKATIEWMRSAGASPERGEAYLLLGETLLQIKRDSFAERNLSIAAGILGVDGRMARAWGESLEGKGDFRRALKMFERALSNMEGKDYEDLSEKIEALKRKIADIEEKISEFENEFALSLGPLSEQSKKELREFLWNRISEGASEDLIREEVQKAFQISRSEMVFDNGLIKLSFPSQWYEVWEETKPGSPIALFRRWPGDTQLAFYSVQGEGSLKSAIEIVKRLAGGAEATISDEDLIIETDYRGADGMAFFHLNYDFEELGPQNLSWWIFHFDGCKSFCVAASLIGYGGVGTGEIEKIASEMRERIFSSIQFRKEIWKLEEGIAAQARIYFPLPPAYAGNPPFSEKESPWKITQGPGFTLLIPPGMIGRTMRIPWPGRKDSADLLWLKGEFMDNDGRMVKVGDQEFFGYVHLMEMESEKQSIRYTLGEPQPSPPSFDARARFLAGEKFTDITREATGSDPSWVGRFLGDRFQGVWLIFRLSYKKRVVEFVFPLVKGEDSPSLFWIPTTFRVKGMPPAFPPVEAAEKFHIFFKKAPILERRNPLGKQGDLFTPEFSLEVPSGWRLSINYRSVDGYPITLKEERGKAFVKIIKKGKEKEIRDVKEEVQKEICETCDFEWFPIKGVKKKKAKWGVHASLDIEEEHQFNRWNIYLFKTKRGEVFLILTNIPREELESFALGAIQRIVTGLYFK